MSQPPPDPASRDFFGRSEQKSPGGGAPTPDAVPTDSPDFFESFVAKLEAQAAELATIADSMQAATEVEVSNRFARLRLHGAQIVELEFTDAAVAAAKSDLAQQVMSLYLDGQAQLARRNAAAVSGMGIDLMSGMPTEVRERAAEQEQEQR